MHNIKTRHLCFIKECNDHKHNPRGRINKLSHFELAIIIVDKNEKSYSIFYQKFVRNEIKKCLNHIYMLPIITEIRDRNHFAELLVNNPGALIIKFGADWCGPCKVIEKDVLKLMNLMPDNVQSAIIDVDKCVDVYSFLKSKKMVNGIPVILVYYKGNLNYVPDDRTVGANIREISNMFNNTFQKVNGKR